MLGTALAFFFAIGKPSLYARQRIVNLHQLGKSVREIASKIREEDNINASRSAVSLFLTRFRKTGTLYDNPRSGRNKKLVIRHFDVIDEEMRRNDELSSIELARILLARYDIKVSPRTVRRVRKKLGWTWSGTKYCQLVKDVNKLMRMEHCLKVLSDRDDFADVIFSDECSVSIERSTRRSFHKVGEPRRLKGKPKHPLKVSFHFSIFCSLGLVPSPSITRPLPFPYLGILATLARCKQVRVVLLIFWEKNGRFRHDFMRVSLK